MLRQSDALIKIVQRTSYRVNLSCGYKTGYPKYTFTDQHISIFTSCNFVPYTSKMCCNSTVTYPVTNFQQSVIYRDARCSRKIAKEKVYIFFTVAFV